MPDPTRMQIKHKITGAILFEGDYQSLRDLVQAAVGAEANLRGANLEEAYLEGAYLGGANLREAYLGGANLREAYLEGANLRGAYLRGANLRGAYLRGASLGGANLEEAYLGGANLRGANLGGANLEGANLREAYLEGANLRGANFREAKELDAAVLESGETFAKYKSEVVPALLTAGGKTVEEVLASGCWDCHEWTNCPMAVAFSVNDLSHIPLLHQPRARQFVQLFDAKLIPKPTINNEVPSAESN